jgi:hypothetical protein
MQACPEADAEFTAWVASQPLLFGVVDGRGTRLPEERQGDGRLALARGIAVRAFDSEAAADAWLAAATPDLGGLSPADLVADSDEGSRLALFHLVRHRRRAMVRGDG